MKIEFTGALATWLTDAPKEFGEDYPELRAALVHRDADTVARILDEHGQLDRLLPILDDVEALERAVFHDDLNVVRTVDAQTLAQHWELTPEGLAAVDEFA